MYKRILIATDGSPLSRKAVRGGIDLAASLEAAAVIVNVVPRYPASYFEGAITYTPEDMGRIEKQWAEQGQAIAEAARLQAEGRGVAAKAVVVQSDRVGESLLAAAKKHKCDLIVMASHGRKGISRLLLGSETQHVLTHGGLPVLVLR